MDYLKIINALVQKLMYESYIKFFQGQAVFNLWIKAVIFLILKLFCNNSRTTRPLCKLWRPSWTLWTIYYIMRLSISGFVIEELDSVQFFCLESDSIGSFSSSTGFLRVDFRHFWFRHINCYFICRFFEINHKTFQIWVQYPFTK